MEEDESIWKVKGDSPLEGLEQDEFGLTGMVDGVAAMLAIGTPNDGFTLGIEGPWGSGKSTFANFVVNKLRKHENHFVIRFEPWLIGEKSALIASFLGQFASEIDKCSPKQWKWCSTEGGSDFGDPAACPRASENTGDISARCPLLSRARPQSIPPVARLLRQQGSRRQDCSRASSEKRNRSTS